MYGPQAGGDVRPVPVQYGLRPAGVLAVADGLSSGAAGVELTRSRLPVLRAAVRCPLCGGNESSCDPSPAGQAGPIAGRKAVDHSKRRARICTVISLLGRAAVAAEPHTRCTPIPTVRRHTDGNLRQKRKHHSHVVADTPPMRAAVTDSFRPALAAFACYRSSQPPEIHVTRLHCATWCRFIVRNPGPTNLDSLENFILHDDHKSGRA